MKFEDQEPNADLRAAAGGMHQIFVALVKAGFSESQALTIVTDMLKQSIANMKE